MNAKLIKNVLYIFILKSSGKSAFNIRTFVQWGEKYHITKLLVAQNKWIFYNSEFLETSEKQSMTFCFHDVT